ncbi:MAG TPA: hypothetical protein VGM90_19075 [Kofleriaceae bacterium]
MTATERLIASNRIAGTDLETELYKRGVVALFKSEDIPSQPAASTSGVEVHNKRSYLVLRNARGVLAVYRVRNDGKLKRIRERLPSRLAQEAKGE